MKSKGSIVARQPKLRNYVKALFGSKNVAYYNLLGKVIRKDRLQFHKKSLAQPIRLLFLGRLIKEKGIARFISLVDYTDRRTEYWGL